MSYCADVFNQIRRVIDQRYLFGNKALMEYFLLAYFARGHLLIEGPPGTGKTMTAKLFAKLLSKSFSRIQFTSDMLPADIIGAHMFSPASQAFNFIAGPLFSDFILADEINRTPPRTQSALLEAMEERQITAEGETFPLSADFFVVATQNPQDLEGTFPLPEAQLDRFLFKVVLTHLSPEEETQLLAGIIRGDLPPPFNDIQAQPVDRAAVDREIQGVRVDDSLLKYVSQILALTRKHPMLRWGSSARGGIAIVRAARILALLENRAFVIPDDIKKLLAPTFRHRIRLSPDAQISGVTEDDVIAEITKNAPFPQ